MSGRNDRDLSAVACVAAGYALLTGFLSWRLPLWTDELYTLHTTADGPMIAAHKALSFELQPPVYFVIQALWRMVFPAPLAARVPSIVFGTAAVVVGAMLARTLMPELRARWPALVIACHPLVLWAGAEARCYALVMLIGAGIAYVFVRTHVQGWQRGRLWMIAIAVLALYTQYYLGFLLAAAGLSLIVTGRYRQAGRYALEMLVVLVLFAPLALVARTQALAHASPASAHPFALTTMLVETWRGVSTLAIGAVASPWKLETASAPMLLRRLFRFALLAGVAAMVAQIPRASLARARSWIALRLAHGTYKGLAPENPRDLRALSIPGFLAALTASAFLFGWVLTSIASTPWDTRHWLGLVIPAVLLPLAIARAIGPRTAEAAIMVLLVGSVAASIDSNRGLAKAGDSQRVARALEQSGAKGEPVLIVPADNVLSLSYYYSGPNRLVPVPRAPSLETYRHANLFPANAMEVREAIEPLGELSAVWVYADGARAAGEMGRYLDGGWREDQRLAFWDGAWLIHFRRGD
ncbi:MAG: glycosyltransferase family 39 protein [Deltaproteobacteria bacterium]|nr:glycosyltransferase family 39 protein [Deltaproteobacteria bacterium]